MSNLNKEQLVTEISNKTGSTKKEADNFVNAFIDVISDVLSNKGKVALIGFGTFQTSDRKATTGRNPRTGDVIQIPAKTVPNFKPGKALKEKVQNG